MFKLVMVVSVLAAGWLSSGCRTDCTAPSVLIGARCVSPCDSAAHGCVTGDVALADRAPRDAGDDRTGVDIGTDIGAPADAIRADSLRADSALSDVWHTDIARDIARDIASRDTPGEDAMPDAVEVPSDVAPLVCDPTPSCTPPRCAEHAVRVTAGANHTCAVMTSGAVLCWGANDRGQLGVTGGDRPTPAGVPCTGEVAEIDASGDTTCALRRDGTVVCWGDNTGHALGDGSAVAWRAQPSIVPGLAGVTLLSVGLAILEDRSAVAWGPNDRGQRGVEGDGATPQPVTGLASLVRVGTRRTTSCVISAGNRLSCWGANDAGQLGDGTRLDRAVPRVVMSITAASVASSARHTCASDVRGVAWCWGANDAGQLGDGAATTDHLRPFRVADIGANEVVVGDRFSCLRSVGGMTSCWGANDEGQLGDGMTAGRTNPSPVPTGAIARAIAAGGRHACAIIEGERTVCWGANNRGQVGDGTTEMRRSPARAL